MKKILTFILLVAITSTTMMAQNRDTKKADDLYDRLAYVEAAKEYQKLIKKNKANRYVYERLANSYYFINDTKQAETFYKRVVKGKKVDSETVYRYAQSLKANGDFAESNTWMKNFAEMKPNDNRARQFMKNPDYLPQLMDKKAKFSASNLAELNSDVSDFGGILVGKEFYFSSARNAKGKTYDWNNEPYLDLYKAQSVGGTIKNDVAIKGDVNTKYHEANAVLSADGKRMYFDRNDYLKGDFDKSEEGINQINLYYAEKVGNDWKDVQSVPFNSNEFSTGHPALSPDGNTLYFSSDMPGGEGGADIYMVQVNTDGTFGNPSPVPGLINTEGTEAFPFVDENGTLYFSSDGHLGLGGLDVFYAEVNGSSFEKPKNMGNVINSVDDDFAFKFNAATQEGFVSSNRKGGKGSDDIYAVKQLEPLCDSTATVEVVDANTKTPLAGVTVDLYDMLENKIGSQVTASNGTVTFDIPCDIKHIAQAAFKDYESNAVDIAGVNDGNVRVTLPLRPIEDIVVVNPNQPLEEAQIVLNPIYFDFDRSNIRPQAAFELDKIVTLMNKYPTLVVRTESHTDTRGSAAYNNNLSNRRAQSTVQYIISKGINASRISGTGLGEQRPVNTCGAGCSEDEHQANRRSMFYIVTK